MKFGKTLIRNQLPEWSRHYLNYKGLKKEIKNGRDVLANGESTMDDVLTAFMFQLDREVEKVNNFFLYKRAELERRLRILTEKTRRFNPNILTATVPPIPASLTDPRPPIANGPTKSRLNLSIVTSTKEPATAGTVSTSSGSAPHVPPSPFISDPEADAECLQAMMETKEMLSKLSWFAEMNRRAVAKILKKFDKRMCTVSRDDYLRTKVSMMPFVTDGQLLEMAVTTDVLIREMKAVVADHPSAQLGLAHERTRAEDRLGFTDEQIKETMKAIEEDDATALKNMFDTKLKENPELKRTLFASVPLGRVGQLPRSLFRKACQEMAFQCIALIMSFGAGALMANVNDQTMLHKLAIEGGTFANTQDSEMKQTPSASARPTEHAPAPRDDPTLITFILQQLSKHATQDSLCTLKSTADIFGRRPLHYAAMYGFANITRALMLDLKASGEFVDFSNPYWFDTDGFTPLIYAVSGGQAGALQVLIEEGGIKDVDAVTNACATLASIPKVMPSTPIAVLNPLVGSDANLHVTYTYTPLSIACRMGHVEAAKLLIHYGANLDAQDEDGESCLIIAAKNGHVECVKMLIAGPQPANLELRERYYGWTALHLADSPPASGGRSSVKASKTVHRAYGHKYLADDSLILVTLGSNDIRSTVEPVELFHTDQQSSFLTASTAFSLEITSENATSGEKAIIDLPLKDSSYHEQIVFYAPNPEDVILNFSVYPTFGQLSDKLLGRGTAMLSSLDNLRKDVKNQHPEMTTLQGMNMTVPIFGIDSMAIIGRVRVEFTVVRPFKHENLKVGSKHTYWKSLTTTIIGHRGLGMNRNVSNLQLGENTLLSFVTAASLGAEYIEFDVQMTKDMVPVLYHDWTVTETGLDIPVSSVTLDQFHKLSGKKRGHGGSSTPSSPRPDSRPLSVSPPPSSAALKESLMRPELPRRTSHNPGTDSPGSAKEIQSRLGRSNSLGAMAKLRSLTAASEPQDPKAKMKGNGLGTIQAPFATLKDTFETVPSRIGFNIEVKYPMLDEAEDANIPLYTFEMNRFVDRILKEVYDHDQTQPDRNIIFSSFHPDICLLLNLKQPNYPVFFLTDGGTSVIADRRCNSIQAAVRFATSIDLLGIVTHSLPIIEAPNLIKGIKETGLLVFTYGTDNNDVENARLQRRHGVDAVIVDSVLAVRKGLQQAD
ncbi:Glycerophosphocholine phosphodiesterase [Mortierella polycephala]|uniref:Glycerophosphocholine phosphodiesterase n=1 Tax=Mortierella polycephala TaxID=41804 RepID=A0A9P6PWQ6_9FUNG|nr:Glycerophosphocholine phosphodiesterase [Mortierella polycephala]